VASKNPVKRLKAHPTSSPVIEVNRKVDMFVRLLLGVRAGGMCEFDGCRDYLFEHQVTLDVRNFAEVAHIVAWSERGPRGDKPRPADINEVDNLMLLCPKCHKLVDDEPERFPIAVLKDYKQAHEERIRHLTSLAPDMKTSVVQLKTIVRGQAVDIPITYVTAAVAPRYPTNRRGEVIDLTAITATGPAYWDAATQCIQQKVQQLYHPGMDLHRTQHISLFALAPIPLLVYLGSCLSNKIPVQIFQRHRDTEDWVWKRDGKPVQYRFHLRQEGSDRKKVGLLLALSGPIDLDTIPGEVRSDGFLYEITLAEGLPQPQFLRLEQDLVNFKETYETARRTIARDHGSIAELHLFAAVPAPVAITCGRDLLRGVDPTVVVYENDRASGGFTYILRINEP
jgi:hypothetical protein